VPVQEQLQALHGIPRSSTWVTTALQPARAVGHEHGVPFGTRRLPLPQAAWRSRAAHCRGTVDDHLDGTLSLGHGPHPVGHEDAAGRRFPPASQAVGQAA